MGCSSISGGGVEEVKCVVERKWGALRTVECVVLLIGGNDATRMRDGVQLPRAGYEEMKEMQEGLVRWVKGKIPHVKVVTMDIVPRDSERGFFNVLVRRLAHGIESQGDYHRHVNWSGALIWESRVKAVKRYRIRAQYFRDDGVHLSEDGQDFMEVCVCYAVAKGVEREMFELLEISDEEGLVVPTSSGVKCYVPKLKF